MDIERVINELYKCIDIYGIADVRTLEKSQELDKLIVNKKEN